MRERASARLRGLDRRRRPHVRGALVPRSGDSTAEGGGSPPAPKAPAGRRRRPATFAGATEGSECERGDSNPHGVTHRILNPARLPIPPLSRGRALVILGPPR